MPAKKKTKKAATKKKKLASAKKSPSKSKKPASKKKSAGAKRPAAKLKKGAKKAAAKLKKGAKKPAGKKKRTAKARQKPEISQPETPQAESFFVDAGRLETEIYEPEAEVKEEFAEAAALGDPSRRSLLNELRDNAPAESPALSGGDVDAAWDQSDVSGEETVGGSNPTPDQDIVEDLGRAVGLNYQDNEPLDTNEKVTERDRHRWELEPESSEDFDERNRREE
jgi:Family of unknown function (DUF6335)